MYNFFVILLVLQNFAEGCDRGEEQNFNRSNTNSHNYVSSRRDHHDNRGGYFASVSSTFDALLSLLSNKNAYDSRFRPHFGGHPVEIYCSVYITSVRSVSETDMDYTVDFYILQAWEDERLKWESEEDEIVNIAFDHHHLLWQPDTYIINAKYGRVHDVTKANTFLEIGLLHRPVFSIPNEIIHSYFFYNEEPHGHIQQSSRITLTVMCNMDFRRFPFDMQICSMTFEAFSLPISDATYFWLIFREDENPYLDATTAPPSSSGSSFSGYSHAAPFAKGASLINYETKGYRIYETSAISHDGFNHSRLVVDLIFTRKLGFYLIQFYLPATVMTISSWISFWIPRNSAPARVTLSVTVNLATVSLCLQETHLPRVPYLKALEVYMFFCFFMAFLNLVEYAAVSSTENVDFSNIECLQENVDHPSRSHHDSISFPSRHNYYRLVDTEWHVGIPGKVENISRVAFPAIFVAFAVFYWLYYFFLDEDYNTILQTAEMTLWNDDKY